MDNRFNEVFHSFDPLNPEFRPGNRVIDNFPDHFSFHLFVKSKDSSSKLHIQQLNALAIDSSSSVTNVLIIIDTSIRNNVVLSIAHIHVHDKPMVKTLHHTINVTSIKVEFFALCCGINQATQLHNIFRIIVITDSIHTTKKIFDLLSHSLQKQSASILRDLRSFFTCCPKNTIEFWECPSKSNWYLHKVVDSDTKSFYLTSLLLNRYSWDFSKKAESDDLINKWKMTFQASDLKDRSFLDLIDSDDNILELSYCKVL